MRIIDKRNPLPGILMIVRLTLVFLCLAAMIVFAALALVETNKKGDVIEFLNSDNTISIVPAYSKSNSRRYASSDMGTFIGYVNYDYTKLVENKYNQIDIFKERYHEIIDSLPADTPNLKLTKFLSRIDEQSVFDMWLAGFGKEKARPYLDEIHTYDVQFLKYYAYYAIFGIALILIYVLVRPRDMFSGWLPKGEKSSIAGIPVYLTNVLCYLTCGVVGVLLFLFERRSRFAKQNAVQAMLIGILSAITVLMASMMHRIFSYMFPPVQNVTLMIKYSTILFCALLLLSGLVLALLGRKFSLPIVGNLSIKSSHCDTLDTYDDEKK